MRQVRHPHVARDLDGLVDHIIDVTGGDFDAAARRLDEIDALLAAITDNPLSGTRLADRLSGWLVRHGGRDRRITIVFRPDPQLGLIYIAMIAFGGRDWLSTAEERRSVIDR